MKPFILKVVTPTRELYNGEAEHVRLPGTAGLFGVLASHAPLLSLLGIGPAQFRTPQGERILAITGGYAEVLGECVTVIARSAEYVEDIDAARADAARRRALDRIAAHEPSTNLARARTALQRAALRLSLSRAPRNR